MDYLDFEVEIGPGAGGDHTVTVLRSPAGEATESIRFALDGLALENRLQALQIALLRSSGTWRRVDSVEADTVRQLGQELWRSLFAGDVLLRLESSSEVARQRKKGLRVKLRIASPQLAALPWEYLYDPNHSDYLTLSTSTPLVRYIPLPQAMEPLAVRLPLRILAVAVSPDDMPGLDVERERARLERAIAPLRDQGAVELVWLQGRTWRDLQRALRRESWHIFHFVGHGGFDAVQGEGLIVLADEEGAAHRLSATDLGRLLGDHEPLRLAVLNSCDSARADRLDVFSSTAATLVRRGTPAVVAMQYEITDQAAIEFSRSFYEAIADDMAVDCALAEARKGVALAIPNTLEWGTPVLFMRSPDGVLFKLSGRGKRRAAAAAAAAAGAVAGTLAPAAAATEVDEAAEREREVAEAAEAAERQRVAAEVAEEARLAAEAAERERVAAEAAEAAERDRLAAEAAEAAERDRLAVEAAERDRLAAEAAERDRLAAAVAAAAAAAAERDRVAAEAAEAAERQRVWAEAAERQRQAAETAERERLAAEENRELRLRLDRLEADRVQAARSATASVGAQQDPAVRAQPAPTRSAKRARSDSGHSRRVAVVGVLALGVAAAGLFAFANQDRPSRGQGTTVPGGANAPEVTSAPELTSDVAEEVLLPDVYKVPETEALEALRADGFTRIKINRVCSGSVDAGLVREVILDDGSSFDDKTVLVGPGGSDPEPWPVSTPILVKIANGQAC